MPAESSIGDRTCVVANGAVFSQASPSLPTVVPTSQARTPGRRHESQQTERSFKRVEVMIDNPKKRNVVFLPLGVDSYAFVSSRPGLVIGQE